VKLLFLALLAGCATLGTVQTADTVGKGRFQFAIEPGFWGGTGLGGVALPRADIAGRYGVTDWMDLGARVGTTGVEFTSKVQLTPPAMEAFVVSVAPSVGGLAVGTGDNRVGTFWLHAPLLLGFGLGGGHQLILGPRVHDWTFFGAVEGASGVASVVSLGTSVGISFKLGKHFRLLPEAVLMKPVAGRATWDAWGLEGDVGSDGGALLFQGTLGLLFGGGRS
jgi:hypothetical protein